MCMKSDAVAILKFTQKEIKLSIEKSFTILYSANIEYKYSSKVLLIPGDVMRYGVTTGIAPDRVMEKAIEFFKKLDLEVTRHGEDSITMEGGGGRITITVTAGDSTEVDIVTDKWDTKVKDFIQRIGC